LTFAFGDGQTGTGLISSGTVTVSHSYTEAGVYTVTLTVSDDVGGVVTTSLFIAVYDPEGGFVTGGGWFNSPTGAFRYVIALTMAKSGLLWVSGKVYCYLLPIRNILVPHEGHTP
jgi:PKD repeat protein